MVLSYTRRKKEVRVLIGWLANALASQPIKTRAAKSSMFAFMLRWPSFLTASIIPIVLKQLKIRYASCGYLG